MHQISVSRRKMANVQVWDTYRAEEQVDYVNRYLTFCRKVLSSNQVYYGGKSKCVSNRTLYPHMTLSGGSVISIQAGDGVDSEPSDNNAIVYTKVQLTPIFLNAPLPRGWLQYVKNRESPKRFYSNLPVEILNRYINTQGGFVVI